MLTHVFTLLLLFIQSQSFDYFKQGEDWEATCARGKKQSPIDFKDCDIIITDHTEEKMNVYVDLEDEFQDFFKSDYVKGTVSINRYIGVVEVNSIVYSIIGAHYHSPSEHTVNGENYDLEIHLVGQSEDAELHVFAILFEVGEKMNEFVEETIKNIDSRENTIFRSSWLLADGNQDEYYFYNGSLTGPTIDDDCIEGVRWTVMKEPLSITEKQLEFFNDRWAGNETFAGGYGNARKVQKLNNRKVYLHSAIESWSIWIYTALSMNFLI